MAGLSSFLEALGENLVPCLFQILEVAHIPQLVALPSIFKANNIASLGTSLVVQRLRLRAPNVGGLGSIPGQGIRSHMQQLKIPHAATKTQHSQINK